MDSDPLAFVGLSVNDIKSMYEYSHSKDFDFQILKQAFKLVNHVELRNVKVYHSYFYLYFFGFTLKKHDGKYYIKLDDRYENAHYIDERIQDGQSGFIPGKVIKYKWQIVE